MAGRNPQTQAKRAREVALREKRERKQAKKAEVAARRALIAAGIDPDAEALDPDAEVDPDAVSDEIDSDEERPAAPDAAPETT